VTTAEFLRDLQSRGFRVWVDGDRVRLSAPAGALTDEVRAELRTRKPAVLTFLRQAESLASQQRAIVPLRSRGHQTPIFAVPGHNGNVFSFRTFAQALGDDQPFYGLQPPGVDGREPPLACIDDIATYFAEQIREFGSTGPFTIAGHCSGGTIAFELARQLRESGAEITTVAMFGASFPTWWRRGHVVVREGEFWLGRVLVHSRAIRSLPVREAFAYVRKRLGLLVPQSRARDAGETQEGASTAEPVQIQHDQVGMATRVALIRHLPRPYPGHVDLYLPGPAAKRRTAEMLRWRRLAGSAEVYVGPEGCATDTMLQQPWVLATTELFKRARDRG
jgi:thioesterase domain-containing protein